MTLRVVIDGPAGPLLDAETAETFRLAIPCAACWKPIEDGADGWLVWRAPEAWHEGGTAPVPVHDACRDALLRSRYTRRDLGLVRMKPLGEMLAPLAERLAVASESDDDS